MSIELERMTPSRAAYFMDRFKREEKLLGPNEQAALTYVIDMLEKATSIQQAEAKTDVPVYWKYQPQDGLKHPAFTEHEAIAIAHGKDGSVVPLYTHPAPGVPFEAISGLLADAITQAAANGANSISMPDEYVEIAKWLYAAQAQKGK